MEDQELPNTCDFCDVTLKDPWFKVKAYRYMGWKVIADFQFRMCQSCYPKIHYPVRRAAFALMQQLFQDAMAKLKQDLHKAGRI